MDVDLHEWVVLAKQVRRLVGAKAAFSLKDLAISGKDLIQAGMKPGKGMGETLNKLLGLVLEDPTLNKREALLDLAFR
jgi:tRNA nucleotidyltransferase (CCA-adding enzyme)